MRRGRRGPYTERGYNEAGRRWRELRESLGLTQRELADVLYCAESTVARWEQGVKEPNRHFQRELERLAERGIGARA